MTDFLQDQAALYALGLLDPEEARALEQLCAHDPELDQFVRDLQHTIAETTRALPCPDGPPAALRTRIFDQVRQRKTGDATARPAASSGRSFWSPLGWGLAAALAVAATWLLNERQRLEHEISIIAANEAAAREQASLALKSNSGLDDALDQARTALARLTGETDTLRQRNALAQMQIATLQSSLNEYSQGVAVVVWDSEKHQGVLKLEKMPPLAVDKDYQLWVVDPAKSKPVNAGIVQMDANGFATIDFKPVVDVSAAAKFALSIERKGGVPENEGPIVLIGP